MNSETQKLVIENLEERIVAECDIVNREEHFDAVLDDCYSFESVGGPFAYMSPSQVLRECDPIAHRCGVNDYADGEEWVEVAGETYQQADCEAVKAELVSELEDEESSAADAESETALAEIRARLAALKAHSF